MDTTGQRRFRVGSLAFFTDRKGQKAKDKASGRGESACCPLMDKNFFLNTALISWNTNGHRIRPLSARGAKPGAIPGIKLLVIILSDFFQAKVLRNRILLSRLTITC